MYKHTEVIKWKYVNWTEHRGEGVRYRLLHFLHWHITRNQPCLQTCTLNDTQLNTRMTFTAWNSSAAVQQVPVTTWYNICWIQGHSCYLIQCKFLSGSLYLNGFCFPKVAAIFLLKAHVGKIPGDSVSIFSLVPDALYRIIFKVRRWYRLSCLRAHTNVTEGIRKKLLCWNLFRPSCIFHWSIWHSPLTKNTDDRFGGQQCGTFRTSSLYLMGDKPLRTSEVSSR